MKYSFLLLLVTMLFVACKGNRDAGTAPLGAYIYFVDSSGNSLFSTTNDGVNGYWIDSLRVWDFNGSKREITCFEGGLGYNFVEFFKAMTVHFCPNSDVINRYYTSLIQIRPGDNDTLKVHITEDQISPNANVDQVYYNGILIPNDPTLGYVVVK